MTPLPTRRIEFFVYGIAAPGGSKTPGRSKKTGRVFLRDACKRNKPWRQCVAGVAAEMYMGPLLTGPIALTIEFVLPRPKYHYRTGKRAGELKPDAPTRHTKAPDATKLLRAVEDALTGIIWFDDAQVCDQTVSKRYGERPGARVIIEELDDTNAGDPASSAIGARVFALVQPPLDSVAGSPNNTGE